MEKLSSGYRINRAADDAAGLAISEKMRGQIGGLAQAQRNAQDGISLVQTAEGALDEVHSMLQRVRDLKVQFDNGTLDDRRQDAIAAEVVRDRQGDQQHLDRHEVQRQAAVRRDRRFTFQVGANDGETISTRRGTSPRRRGAGGGLSSSRARGDLRRRRAPRRQRRRLATDDARHDDQERLQASAATSARCRTASSIV